MNKDPNPDRLTKPAVSSPTSLADHYAAMRANIDAMAPKSEPKSGKKPRR